MSDQDNRFYGGVLVRKGPGLDKVETQKWPNFIFLYDAVWQEYGNNLEKYVRKGLGFGEATELIHRLWYDILIKPCVRFELWDALRPYCSNTKTSPSLFGQANPPFGDVHVMIPGDIPAIAFSNKYKAFESHEIEQCVDDSIFENAFRSYQHNINVLEYNFRIHR